MSFIAVPRIRLSFFRAWLRQQGLNPDQYHPDDEPCERLRPNKVVRAASNAMAKTSGDEKEFPNPLTLEREKRSLTLEHMADLMGLKPASLLRDYERGVRLPTLGHAIAFEMIFKMPIHSLFPALASQARDDLRRREHKHKFLPLPKSPMNFQRD